MFFREWFIVFIVASFIGVVFLAQSFSSRTLSLNPCDYVPTKIIKVEVSGAVLNPGLYEVLLGTSIQSILQMAQPARNADKTGLYLQKKLLGSCSLFVPEKKSRKNKKKNPSSSNMLRKSYTD